MSWPEESIIVIPYSTKSIVVENNCYKFAKAPSLLLGIEVFTFSNSIKCTRKNLEDFFKYNKRIPCIFLVSEGDIDKMKGFLELFGLFEKDTKEDLPDLHKIEKSVEDYNSNIRLDSNKLLIMRSSNSMSMKEDLLKIFNDVVEEDNEIDAVFVYHPKDGLVGVHSDPSSNKTRQVNIDAFERVLGDIATSKIVVKGRADLGLLEHTTYHFSEGILNVTIMQEGFKELFILCFVSATPEGLGEMLRYKRGNMSDINTKLRAAGL
ncbi:hypothetical protein QUF74_03760 [Candidatus Halobeggiatoa sp. HSG11]|nr:hypothetical protein [Candidatus Halobeggiatoa sp. HSG11]